MSDVKLAFNHFRQCAEDAPEGCYEDAKALNKLIGDAADKLMKDVRALGLNADACDLIHAVEVAIYDYVRESNLDSTLFPAAEGFGRRMEGPERERVLEQAERSRDALQALLNPQS
jgi:hypothetical protein